MLKWRSKVPSRGYGNEILWKHGEKWSQSGTPRGVCGVEAKTDTTSQASNYYTVRIRTHPSIPTVHTSVVRRYCAVRAIHDDFKQ